MCWVPRREGGCRGEFCPAFVGRRAEPIAPRPSAGARAAWNKWKGPAQRGGGRLCRERPLRRRVRRYGSHKRRPTDAARLDRCEAGCARPRRPARKARVPPAAALTLQTLTLMVCGSCRRVLGTSGEAAGKSQQNVSVFAFSDNRYDISYPFRISVDDTFAVAVSAKLPSASIEMTRGPGLKGGHASAGGSCAALLLEG